MHIQRGPDGLPPLPATLAGSYAEAGGSLNGLDHYLRTIPEGLRRDTETLVRGLLEGEEERWQRGVPIDAIEDKRGRPPRREDR